MTDTPMLPYSLQRRLLILLCAVIALSAAVQAAFAYRAALAQADQVFDQQMEQLALMFRSGAVGASEPSAGTATGSEELAYVVQVWSADGRQVYQSSRRIVIPARRRPGFSVMKTDDGNYRVFSLSQRGRSVQVAQDLAARAKQARRMALANALPIALMVPVLMALVAWVVRRSLAPVERAREQLAQRQPNDLAPVSIDGLPVEVQPLVGEINKLFDRVNHSLQTQKDFVADAAHELRSPLTALKVQIQNLQQARAIQDEGTYGHSLSRLEQGVGRATRLVDQLLSLARYQTSMSEGQQTSEVHVTDLARDCVSELAMLASDRDIDLGLHDSAELRVQGWPETLRILLRNLIENAIKYTPPGGVVDVSVVQEHGRVTLVVEDSGPGIAPDERERVLDRFYRGRGAVDADGSDSAPGSGLGLAIVNSIAQAHQAELSFAKSPRLGGLRASVSFQPA